MTSQTIPTALAVLQIQRTKKEPTQGNQFKKGDNVFAKSISGATSGILRSYVIPTVEIEPEFIVIHCDTNELQWTVNPNVIACEIVDLRTNFQTDKNAIIRNYAREHRC